MARYASKTYSGKRVNKKRLIIYFIFLLMLVSTTSLIDSSGLKIFNAAPALTFIAVCAIGFIFGDKSGAIFGIVGGFLTDALGFSGVMISPIIFMFFGYLCGRLVGWFLSKNLPSFIVYGIIALLIKEIYTLLIIGVISTDFELFYILGNIILPEYLASLIFICPIYLAFAGIYRLFLGKDKKEFRF